MQDWITIDEAYLLGAMPTALRAAYDAWLAANPAKEGRLAAIAAGVVADFREGVRREGAEAPDPGARAALATAVQTGRVGNVRCDGGAEGGEGQPSGVGGVPVRQGLCWPRSRWKRLRATFCRTPCMIGRSHSRPMLTATSDSHAELEE